MMKVLVILPRVPFPMIDGASKANFQFIKGLSSQGFKVTAICIAPKKELHHLNEFKKEAQIDEALFFERQTTDKWKMLKLLWNFIKSPLKPVTYYSFFDKKLINYLDQKIQSNKFDEIIAITPHCAIPLFNRDIAYIYRSENVEYELWEQSKNTTNNFLKKIFFSIQQVLVKHYEKKIIQQAKLTLTISNEDKEKYLKLAPHSLIEMIPMSFHFSAPLSFPENELLNLFYLGKLDWQPNLDGLVWFLKEIWPELNQDIHRKIHLTIAGSGNPTIIQNLIREIPNNTNITFLGRIASVEDQYQKCDLVIAPIFYGSGTRIKILEASLFGRPCLSTQLGFQGSPIVLEGINSGGLIVQSKEEWLKILENLDRKNLKVLGVNAYQQCKEVLDFDVTAKKVKNLILKLHPESNDRHQ